MTRLISISPSSSAQLRPSQTSQSIVKALTKSRANQNVRLQLFTETTNPSRAPLKRLLASTSTALEKKDLHASKLQRVMNHRNVRSKIVKEKHSEHLLELYFLEVGGNLLDLHQFAKRPKTQQFLQFLKENAIDPREGETLPVTSATPVPPSATAVSSLPGITQTTVKTVTADNPKPSVGGGNKLKTSPILATSTSTCTNSNTSTSTSNTNTSTTTSTSTSLNLNTSGVTNQEQIVEKAKQEAYVVQRVSDLQKEGLWSEKRLPKLQEMPRNKAHWDYLLEEMVWLAADFAQERKWKKAAAKKCARMVQKYFQVNVGIVIARPGLEHKRSSRSNLWTRAERV